MDDEILVLSLRSPRWTVILFAVAAHVMDDTMSLLWEFGVFNLFTLLVTFFASLSFQQSPTRHSM